MTEKKCNLCLELINDLNPSYNQERVLHISLKSVKEGWQVTLEQKVQESMKFLVPAESALGWLRYEALRKLNHRQYKKLCDENFKGRAFDELVDELILKEETL